MKLIKLSFLLLLLFSFPCYAQFKIVNHEDSIMVNNVQFKISSDKAKYKYGEEIRIQYRFKNVSTSNQRIFIKDVNGFPLDMRVSVLNKNGITINGFYSKHIIISVSIPREAKYFKPLKPRDLIIGEFILSDMIILKKDFFDDESPDKILPGEYTINLHYNLMVSNKVKITIK